MRIPLILMSCIFVGVIAQTRLSETDRRVVDGIFGRNGDSVHLFDHNHLFDHIDFSRQHGNNGGVTVDRRTHVTGAILGRTSQDDITGEHGNQTPHPNIHRVLSSGSFGGHGAETHVDLPGQHGNQSPHPVVHRDAGSERPGIKTHIDLPGQRGNQSPHPVIHRVNGSPTHGSDTHAELPGEHTDTHMNAVHDGGNTHVDLPGQHGNQSPHPIIHRDTGPAHKGAKTHVDLPSEHGNNSPVPVVHREISGIGVDRLSEHGNLSPTPSVREFTGNNQNHEMHFNQPELHATHTNSASRDFFPSNRNFGSQGGQTVFGHEFIDPVTGQQLDNSPSPTAFGHMAHSHGEKPVGSTGQHDNLGPDSFVLTSNDQQTDPFFEFTNGQTVFPDAFGTFSPSFMQDGIDMRQTASPFPFTGPFNGPFRPSPFIGSSFPTFSPPGIGMGRPFFRPVLGRAMGSGMFMFGPPSPMSGPFPMSSPSGPFPMSPPSGPPTQQSRGINGLGLLSSVIDSLFGSLLG